MTVTYENAILEFTRAILFNGNVIEHYRRRYHLKNQTLIFSYTHFYDKVKYAKHAEPFLSVKTIDLPENLKSFNTGSSLEKWTKKIPRLKSSKSAKLKPVSPDRSTETDASDVLDNSNDALVEQQFTRTNSIEDEKDETEYEIDPDVQKLLYEMRENENEHEMQKTRPKHRRKKAVGKKLDIVDAERSNQKKKTKRRTKVIRFSLSKPPSPETVQVIRVDVTSNYSIEDVENIENESETARSGIAPRKFAENSESEKVETKKSDSFILKCEKLALSDRK